LEDIGVTVDDEDRILALTTGLDKSYDSFVISLDLTSAAVVRSRTMVRTGLLVRFSVVRSMVLSPARTGPENGSRF
jgi:hypothetical protein